MAVGHFGELLNRSRFGSLQCFDCLEYLECYECLIVPRGWWVIWWAFEPIQIWEFEMLGCCAGLTGGNLLLVLVGQLGGF